MSFFKKLHQKHSIPRPHHKSSQTANAGLRPHLCRIEQMESREMLSASSATIHLGATYLEDCNAEDTSSSLNGTSTKVADLIQITYTGGDSDTQLTTLTLQLNSSIYFDTTDSGAGVSGSCGLTVYTSGGDGFTYTITASPTDGGTILTLTFSDFEAGETLLLSVDVDELGNDGQDDSDKVEGAEFAGSKIIATFSNASYDDVALTSTFHNDYTFTSDLASSLPNNDCTTGVTYVPATAELGEDYTAGAEGSLASISGYVFVDIDGDGVKDSGETGIAGVKVYLLDANGGNILDSSGSNVYATTDSNGYYLFNNLAPGTYGLKEAQPSTYVSVKDYMGKIDGTVVAANTNNTDDLLSGITLAYGQDCIYNNFTETTLTLDGYVYADSNGNGVKDSGESGISGVKLYLLGSTGDYVLDSSGNKIYATTDSKGYYCFDGLVNGTYGVKEVQPTGYYDGRESVGTINGSYIGDAHLTNDQDLIDGIAMTGLYSGVNYNFGEVLAAGLSGYVYIDANNNGKKNDGETGISGVTIYLLNEDGDYVLDGNGDKIYATTNSSGYYCFSDLDPNLTYGVTEVQPSLYADGKDSNYGTAGGTPDNTTKGGDTIRGIDGLVTQTTATGYDFGELTTGLSGYVYYDANSNGKKDSIESGIKGVTIYLCDASGSPICDANGDAITATTNASGYYAFTGLTLGTYTVKEVQPAGYLDGAEKAGSLGGNATSVNDAISAIPLTSSTVGTDYNFGELLPATISGYVYQDGSTIITAEGETVYVPSVRNGVKTSDDTPLVGVTLYLCDGSGVLLTDADGNYITTTTDANGYYSFSVEPGTYSIMEIRPDGYTAGVDLTGSGSSSRVGAESVLNIYTLSTADTSGMTKSLVAEISSSSVSLIANITVKSGDNAVNYNFSEVQITSPTNPNPPPVPPTPPLIEPPAQNLAADTSVLSYAYSLAPLTIMQPIFGGTGGPSGYTWHLSVIDGGSPRAEESNDTVTAYTKSEYFDASTWSGDAIDQGEWQLADQNGKVMKKFRFGLRKSIPVTGDWDGSGTTKIGVFINGLWFFDLNGDGKWDENDLWAKLGKDNDQPVTGDWDGDGKTDIAIFGPMWLGDPRAVEVDPGLPDAQNTLSGRQKNLPPDASDATVGYRTLKRGETGKIRSDVIDHVFQYGTKGDVAVAGDWNGDGINTIGIFRNGTWFLDMDGDGRWSAGDAMVEFGQEGDLPVVGDWNGDGISKIGVYRKGTFYLDTNNNHQLDAHDKVFELGSAGDKPVVGDWNGEGVDKVGIYHDVAVGAVSESIPEAASSAN